MSAPGIEVTKEEDDDGIGFLIDFEIVLVKHLGWSLYDIDNTDIESLIDFANRLLAPGSSTKTRKAYCDEVDWL